MKYAVLILFSFTFGFCNRSRSPKVGSPKNSQDTLIKEVPRDIGTDFFLAKEAEIKSVVNIDYLQNGLDSLQVRIWYPERKINRIISLKYSSRQWTGYLYTFEKKYNERTRDYVFDSATSTVISPSSGWHNFVERLFGLRITTLPDMKEIAGNAGAGADGDTYVIEIATHKRYRLYRYNNPSDNTVYKEVKYMTQIIELLNKEFNIKE